MYINYEQALYEKQFNSYNYIIFGRNVFMTLLCKSAKFYEEKVHHTYINTFGETNLTSQQF